MRLIQELLKDESGFILSAEAVTLGTVGVLGAVVGLNALGNSVNDEMKEMASAIRSLDQSYGYVGHRGCGAWTAGSCYIQPDVQQSLADLSADGDIKSIQQRVETDRKSYMKPAPRPQLHVEPTPTPLPNQLPGTDAKKPDEPKADAQKPENEVVPSRARKTDEPKADAQKPE